MTNVSFKKKFWDNKIITWEREKYNKSNFIFDVNNSLKYRMFLAKEILFTIAKDKTVIEIGCGSGLLMNQLE